MSQNKEFFSSPGRMLIDDNKDKWCDKWEKKGGTFETFNFDIDKKENNRVEWERIVKKLTKVV